MWNDPIVEEIHSVRERIWKDCGYDFEQLVERLNSREAKHKERLVYAPAVIRDRDTAIDAKTARSFGATDQ